MPTVELGLGSRPPSRSVGRRAGRTDARRDGRRDLADLVDDQELGLAVKLQPLLDPVFGIGLGQRGDERQGLSEDGPIAFAHRLDPQRDRLMRLPDAGRPEQNDVLAVGDESALCELLKPLLVDRGLEGEIEALERLDVRELGQSRSNGDVLFLFGGHFLREELVEEVGIGEVVLGRFLESGLQPLVDPVQPEMAEVVLDLREAHSMPPSTRRS